MQKLQFLDTSLYFGPLPEVGLDQTLQTAYKGSRFIILTDEQVSADWTEGLVSSYDALKEAEIIEVPAGEDAKSLEVCKSVWEALTDYEINRNDVIINLGGGAISDLGGFVAGTFKRGMRFINIPTTLLSQVDASLGGKTGIDLGPYKNQIGLFNEPDMVFIDTSFLQSLPQDQLKSGFAEMLKHGLIADASYWQALQTINWSDWTSVLNHIRRSVEIKKQFVEADYKEAGIRRALNFGHTIGHAIEGACLNEDKFILHGFAVGLGMLAETFIARELGFTSAADHQHIESVLLPLYGSYLPEEVDTDQLISIMLRDKKNQGKGITMSLIEGIGKAKISERIDVDLILKSIDYVRELKGN